MITTRVRVNVGGPDATKPAHAVMRPADKEIISSTAGTVISAGKLHLVDVREIDVEAPHFWALSRVCL